MEIESPLDKRKECPKCKRAMQYLFSWIEHDGVGHPGSPIAWVCISCNHKEYFKPEWEPR